jgi:hypothetical protein
MTLRKAAIAIALAGFCALGCSSKSPTSSNGFTINMTVGLTNTAQQATIVGAQLLFDGATVTIASPAAAATSVTLNTIGTNIASGPHTMSVKITDQTSTPNQYTVAMPSVRVFDSSNNLLKTIQLNTQTATLATNGTIDYSFSL